MQQAIPDGCDNVSVETSLVTTYNFLSISTEVHFVALLSGEIDEGGTLEDAYI